MPRAAQGRNPTVLLVGTLDTKGNEYAYLRDRIRDRGVDVLLVLALVAEGRTDAEVADRLVVSLRTVHAHLRSIYRKLDLHTRSAATRYALEHGLAA